MRHRQAACGGDLIRSYLISLPQSLSLAMLLL